MENSYVEPQGRFPSNRGFKVLRIAGWVILGLAFAVVFALVFGLLVKALWNWLMPALFGLGTITYWQAFGIVILAKLLFGGFGPHGRNHREPFHRKFQDRWSDFKGSHEEKDWKYYRDFWRDEGKEAFEAYVRKTEEQKKKEE